MIKTKPIRFKRIIALLLMLIMVFGIMPTTVFADNTSQNVPDTGSDFYSGTVTTRLDGEIPVTDDTYYQNAISTTVANPTLPTIVKQSQSTDTIYDFAAGMPLSTIFIDETKLGALLGTFALESNENQDYTGMITRDPTTNIVSYDPGYTAERHLLNGEATVLSGKLFSFTFEDAAILPNGSRANLKITYSNARIFTDERLKVMEDVAKEHLATAQEQMEAATTPAEIAAAQEAIDAANTELLASYYHGGVDMAQGNNIRHNGSDPRNLTKTASGFSQAQITAAQDAIQDRIDKYKIDAGLSNIGNTVTNGPSLGKSIDTTYEVVDDDGNPINGTFIFVNVGVNLDRDPYTLGSHNANKGMWWVQDVDPNLHFLSEQIAVDNNSIASDYIYVRPNNDKIEELVPGSTIGALKRTGFYPQVVEATENGVTKTKFISNSFSPPGGTSLSGNDGYYSSGFVTLATSGFTVTAYGHGFSNGNGTYGDMNVQAYGGRRIWYRYVSSTGTGGNIQTTSEGNYGGTLNDTRDPRTVINPDTGVEEEVSPKSDVLDPGAYVVPEGKTVTYTLTPQEKYQISKLYVKNASGATVELKFNGRPLHTMQPGDYCQIRDAAGKLCTLTALENGKFKLEMPYAQHDEEVRVEWEPIKGTVTVKKETVDNASGSFSFKISAEKDEFVTSYSTGTAWENAIGSVWWVGTTYIKDEETDSFVEVNVYNTNCKAPDGNDMSEEAIRTLGNLIAGTTLTERVEISGGEYLWKTNKKLSDLGIQFAGEDDDLFVGFLSAADYFVGDTLDDALNSKKERIFFFDPNSTTQEVTSYWNFNEEEGQSDPVEHSFTLTSNAEISFDIPNKYEYKVNEVTPSGWELLSIDGISGAGIASGLLTDENGVTPEHTFLNRKLPDLTVEKHTVNNVSGTFDFTVKFTTDAVAAQNYSVTATATISEGATTYEFNNSGSAFAVNRVIVPAGAFGYGKSTDLDGICDMLLGLSASSGEQSIALGAQNGTVSTDAAQSLTAWETAQDGADGSSTATYSFDSDAIAALPYQFSPTAPGGADYNSTTGEYSFSLSDGGSVTFPDLPYGCSYLVSEGDLPLHWLPKSVTGTTDGVLTADHTASFTNEKFGDLYVKKIVDGNMGDRDRTFSFTFSMPDMAGKTVTGTKTSGTGESEALTLTFDADGNVEFTLGHEDTLHIPNLTCGLEYSISETDGDDYDVSAVLTNESGNENINGSVITGKTIESNNEIVFTNELEVIPSTGIYTDSILYVLTLGFVILCLAGAFFLNRRKV